MGITFRVYIIGITTMGLPKHSIVISLLPLVSNIISLILAEVPATVLISSLGDLLQYELGDWVGEGGGDWQGRGLWLVSLSVSDELEFELLSCWVSEGHDSLLCDGAIVF